MLTTKHPFHESSHYETLKAMVTRQPTLDNRISPKAKAFIKSLLVKNPSNRLCCKYGITELKTVSFFGVINFDEISKRKKPGPYRPNIADSSDTSSFESTFTNELPVDSMVVTPTDNTSSSSSFLSSIFGFTKTKTVEKEENYEGFAYTRKSITKE